MAGRIESKVWGGVFFAFLCSALVLGLLDMRPLSVIIGDGPAAPDLEADRALDAEYYREVDDFLIGQMALRGLGVRARYVVDYQLFGDSTSPQVDVGDHGTLFYTAYQNPLCSSISDFPGFVDPTPSDVEVRYTVISPKSVFYADRVDSRDKPSDCVVAARDDLAAQLDADPLAIPLDPAVAAVAATEAEAFFLTDTHWSPVSRAAVAEEVVEAFAPDLWDPALTSEREVEFRGDLRRLLGASQPETLIGPAVDRSPVTDVDESSAGDLLLTRHTVSAADTVIPGTTLIVGDSQMGYVLPLLDRYFEELHFINWVVLELNPNAVVPDADRVLFETIEFEATGRFTSPAIAKVRDTLGI